MATTREKLLKKLVDNKGRFLSGGELAGELKLSRSAIWKQIKVLQNEGYQISAITGKGYALQHVTDKLVLDELKRLLKSKRLSNEIIILEKVDSTNKYLKVKYADKSSGIVAVAEEQTGGLGRRQRKWVSPKGGLWFSLLFRTSIPLERFPLISLLAASAVVRGIKQEINIKTSIKWPNDVLINDKKICGILAEAIIEPGRINRAIIGIGINANFNPSKFPEDMRASTGTLREFYGKDINRSALMAEVLNILEDNIYRLEQGHTKKIIDEIKADLNTLGRKVQVTTEKSEVLGQVIDIDLDGALIVKLPNGKRERIISGDIKHL